MDCSKEQNHQEVGFICGVSLTHPMMALFFCGEFLLHIPCCLHFYARSFLLCIPCWLPFYYGEFLLHIPRLFPLLLFFFLSREFLLHIPCWFHFYLGSFSYTSRAGFFSYLGSYSYTSRAGFIFIWGVSLTHPMLALFFCGEFFLHIPCWLYYF